MMNKNNDIKQWVDEVLNSFDGAAKAQPRPYLFTRLTAKMQKKETRVWDNALRFLSRPVVAVACAVLVITVNVLVFSFSQPSANGVTTEEQFATTEDFSNAIVVLNDIENFEP